VGQDAWRVSVACECWREREQARAAVVTRVTEVFDDEERRAFTQRLVRRRERVVWCKREWDEAS